MWPHGLIHDINKHVLNLYFRFEFVIGKLDNSLCTSLIIGLKRILMSDTYKKGTTRTSSSKQICKLPDFLANGADLIDSFYIS